MSDKKNISLSPGDMIFFIDEAKKDRISMILNGHVDISEWNLGRLINIEGSPSNRFMLESDKFTKRRYLVIPFRDFNPDDYEETLRRIIGIDEGECVHPL